MLLLVLATAQGQSSEKMNPAVAVAIDSLKAVALPVPDTEPQFPGGEQALMRFLGQNVRYPATAQRTGIQGMVVVSFTVMPDGKLENIKVVKSLGGGLDQEAIRVAKLMPAWQPALSNNMPVAASHLLPIRFTIINQPQQSFPPRGF